MDIPQVLESLRPGRDWGPCAQTHSTYAKLKETWADKNSVCPTEAEMAAEWARLEAARPAKERTAKRAAAAGKFDAVDADGAILRAVVLALLDEVNAVRAKLTPPLPARTAAQVVAAVKAKLAAGAAD